MIKIRRGLSVIGPAVFLAGVLLALLIDIRFGAILMGIGIALHLLSEMIALGAKEIWHRPVAVIIPLAIAVALITVSLLLPRSSL